MLPLVCCAVLRVAYMRRKEKKTSTFWAKENRPIRAQAYVCVPVHRTMFKSFHFFICFFFSFSSLLFRFASYFWRNMKWYESREEEKLNVRVHAHTETDTAHHTYDSDWIWNETSEVSVCNVCAVRVCVCVVHELETNGELHTFTQTEWVMRVADVQHTHNVHAHT